MKSLSYYQELAKSMKKADIERDDKFDAMDGYDHVAWERPQEFDGVSWFHDLPSTGPHDALHTGARVLSTVQPQPTFVPLRNTPEARARASLVEKVLSWHYWLAARRSVNNVTWDVVMSALKYDTIAVQVVYIPWQKKQGGMKKPMWGQAGDFALVLHNPKSVHTKRDAYGIDAVLLCKEVPVSEIVKTWGDNASVLKAVADANDIDVVEMYDYTDAEVRVVWCELTGEQESLVSTYSSSPGSVSLSEDYIETSKTAASYAPGEPIEIIREEHKLPFIPWVVRSGGTNLESESEHQCRPLLDPVYLSGMYDAVAIIRSLRVSLGIAHAAFPRTTSITMDGRTPSIDYTQPGGNVPLKPGESLSVNEPPPVDPVISQLDNELENAMASATVPKLLQDPNVPSGAAFASINTLLRQASTVLDPFKLLAENALADIFSQMLFWVIYSEEPIRAWDTTRGTDEDTGMANYGTELVILPGEIEADDMYLTAKLTATMARDDLARLNAAMLMRQLEVSKNRVFEQLDITDPDAVFDEWAEEQLEMATLQKELKIISAEGDAEAARLMAAVQVESQQAMQAAQPAPQQPPQPGFAPEGVPISMGGGPQTEMEAMQQSLARSAAGIPPSEQLNTLGIMTQAAQKQLGFNPAMGGLPPAMAAPDVTREAVNNQDRQGNPL